MRIVLVGVNRMTVNAAKEFLEDGHEVILIDEDADRFETLAGDLDVGFLEGNASHPQILKQTKPEEVDVLFCLTEDDQENILASMVGRSMGAERVVPKVSDPDLHSICMEVGLEETINPDYTIARALVRMAKDKGEREELAGEEGEND